MTTEEAKEVKGVVLFLSALSLLVLGSFIVDREPLDLFYLLFILSSMIKYLYIHFRG